MSNPTPEELAAQNAQLQAQLNSLRAEFDARMQTLPPQEREQARSQISAGLGSVGDNWWLLLILGVITALVGLVALFSPQTALTWLAIAVGIWLVVSGVFQLIRAFGSGLDGTDRTLLLVSGILSLVLGVLCFRSSLGVVGLLVIIVGIAFLLRGILLIIDSFRADPIEGRGAGLLSGIVLAIAGVVLLVWPDVTASVLVWIVGLVLVVVGLLEIIASFRLRGVAQQFDRMADEVAAGA